MQKEKEGEWHNVITKVKIRENTNGDIIRFYNEMFLEQVKGYVLGLVDKEKQESLPKKIIETMWTQENLADFMTNHSLTDIEQWLSGCQTKEIYIFGESASKKLDKISSMLGSIPQS